MGRIREGAVPSFALPFCGSDGLERLSPGRETSRIACRAALSWWPADGQ